MHVAHFQPFHNGLVVYRTRRNTIAISSKHEVITACFSFFLEDLSSKYCGWSIYWLQDWTNLLPLFSCEYYVNSNNSPRFSKDYTYFHIKKRTNAPCYGNMDKKHILFPIHNFCFWHKLQLIILSIRVLPETQYISYSKILKGFMGVFLKPKILILEVAGWNEFANIITLYTFMCVRAFLYQQNWGENEINSYM